MNSVMWDFHVGHLHGNQKYDTILGRHILFELKIDLCFYNNTIRGNGGAHEGCTAPMKDVSKISLNLSSN